MVAAVARSMPVMSIEPSLVRSTTRSSQSPAAMLLAPMVIDVLASWVSVTSPEATLCEAEVLPVNDAKAAPPTPAAVRATDPPVTRALVRVDARLAVEGVLHVGDVLRGGGVMHPGAGMVHFPGSNRSAPPELCYIG